MEWVRWLESEPEHRAKVAPPPSYRDCERCELKDGLPEDQRRELCAACPVEAARVWETLPPTASERYYEVREWVSVPIEAHDLRGWRYQDLRDLETLRASQRMF
jgi:hypothetical protein